MSSGNRKNEIADAKPVGPCQSVGTMNNDQQGKVLSKKEMQIKRYVTTRRL